MADAFGVTEEYMDTELCCAGKGSSRWGSPKLNLYSGLLLVVVCMPRLIRLEARW